jgi:ubiquinone/menaquinone biosynthesis C-methylase UbiE
MIPVKEIEGTSQDDQLVERVSLYDRMHLKMISLMHDTLYGAFVDPYKLLKAAGLASGQTVLEVGCGPGFFTIPAANIIGKNGHLYTLDINPAAVSRVRAKVRDAGLSNVDVLLADAAKTGLPAKSAEVAFLFGILRSLKELDAVNREMYRVLGDKGILAVQKSSWSEKNLLDQFTRRALFRFVGKDSRLYRFAKVSVEENKEDHTRLTIKD